MEADQQGVMMMRRRRKAEIDTSAPFRSVKEAVMLFGERVLAGEVYSSKLREIHNGTSENDLDNTSRIGTITAELEETKQSLLKAREETMMMANSLTFLQEELQRTKKELQEIKEGKSDQKQVKELMEIDEDLKFVEDSSEFEVKTETIHEKVEFQKKRYVKFADPQSLSQVLTPPTDHAVLQRHPSLRKSKRKPLIPLIKGIFRKRSNSEVASAGP